MNRVNGKSTGMRQAARMSASVRALQPEEPAVERPLDAAGLQAMAAEAIANASVAT